MIHPKLRDSQKNVDSIYEVNIFPKNIIQRIGAHIVYLMYSGRRDITGDDWGDIFAETIKGTHFASPIGIADVAFEKTGWSMKTVKHTHPFNCTNVRLISGRCSPDYSFGITDPHTDIQKTGQAVLAVRNERINIAYEEYNSVRVNVLVRNDDLTEFRMFEEYIERYKTNDYIWKENKNGNLLGINKHSGQTCFTWQPHGAQFTIHTNVPEDAIKFKVKRPPIVSMDSVLQSINFDNSWIQIIE